jgi:tRNA(Ile)-lysidine synthase
MLDRIANILQQECQLHEENCLVVGVSGGPDSLCLVHSLHQLGYQIIAIYVNHGLRPEADKEELQVEQFVGELGVDFISSHVDVIKFAKLESISIEEAARNLRYSSLFEQARRSGAQAVVVGHNADDQVETILLHLLRGSGLTGLRGMEFRTLPNPWSEHIPLVRPLLTTWRSEIQEFVNEHQLNPIYDNSNQDVSFFRNRLRHELLPYLEDYNPSIRQVLVRMSLSLKDDCSLLEELTDNAWETLLIKKGRGYLAFNTEEFLKRPISIKRYFLRKAITYHLPGLRDVGFNCIERGLKLLTGDKMISQTDLIAGLRLIKKGSQFWVTTWQADLHAGDYPAILVDQKLVFQIPSILKLNNDWQFKAEETTILSMGVLQEEASLDPFQAWLNANVMHLPLIARVRMPGDQIRPLGMNGHSIKISDLMINLKLPKQARASWPLVCSGDEIVWVPGYRMSELARVTPGTSRMIHLRLFRDQST